MLNRYLIRNYFGIQPTDRCGHFIDKEVSKIVHKYSDFAQYRHGDWLQRQMRGCTSAVISTDGCWLFTGDTNGMIFVWDLESKLVLFFFQSEDLMIGTIDGHSNSVECLDYSLGSLVSGSKDRSLIIWDAYTLELVNTLVGHRGTVYTASFNQTGDRIVSASSDKTIRTWCVETGNCLNIFMDTNTVFAARYISKREIIAGDYDGWLTVWDVLDGTEQCDITGATEGPISDVSVNCDGSLVACIAEGISISVFSMPDLMLIRCMFQRSMICRFHPWLPCLLAVSECSTHLVRLYNVINGICIATLNVHGFAVRDLCFSPCGRRLISVSGDGLIHCWNID